MALYSFYTVFTVSIGISRVLSWFLHGFVLVFVWFSTVLYRFFFGFA